MISIMKTANKYRIRVPKYISIVGFDDVSESQIIILELTAVHIPLIAITQEKLTVI